MDNSNVFSSQWTCNGESIKNYLNFIKHTLSSEPLFFNFRNNSFPGYYDILEHLNFNQGLCYYNWIKDQNLNLDDLIKIAAENDKIGNPHVYQYDNYSLNPTTLRYLKYAIQISKKFGVLNNFTYFEAGGGYGGLARILHKFHNFTSINLFDLPEALKLQKKYLSKFDIQINEISILGDFEIPNNSIFVSNYALSELNFETRKLYIKKMISKCKYSFIASNIKNLKNEVEQFNPEIVLDCLDDTEILLIKNEVNI